MLSGHSNYFQVVINMSQVPIELSPPHARIGGGGGGGGDCSIDPSSQIARYLLRGYFAAL